VHGSKLPITAAVQMRVCHDYNWLCWQQNWSESKT